MRREYVLNLKEVAIVSHVLCKKCNADLQIHKEAFLSLLPPIKPELGKVGTSL